MFFSAETIDDLLRVSLKHVLEHGVKISPSQGSCKEVNGVLLELTNPRARLSQTETKGKVFSCLGDLTWYLSASDNLAQIEYYITAYRNSSDDGKRLQGAYGPRIFLPKGESQYERVKNILERKPDSRQAVIQLFDSNDIAIKTKDVPCTCTLQFFIRDSKLDMITTMRSNDAFLGLPHDIFSFTMIQEILSIELKVGLGNYKHFAGSLHVYNRDELNVKKFLEEGWQDIVEMPPMPSEKLWPSINALLCAENSIRSGSKLTIKPADIDDYWRDLIVLLQIFKAVKDADKRRIIRLKNSLKSPVYEQYARNKIRTGRDPVWHLKLWYFVNSLIEKIYEKKR